jgi:hypothetical protein
VTYNVRAKDVRKSAVAVGPNAHASVTSAHATGPEAQAAAGAASDRREEALRLVGELLRGIEERWATLPEADVARRNMRDVRSELKDPEPDKASVLLKLRNVMSSVKPVTALIELAETILDLVSHLH